MPAFPHTPKPFSFAPAALATLLAVLAVVLGAPPAFGQTVGDKLRGQVREGLESEKEKRKRKKQRKQEQAADKKEVVKEPAEKKTPAAPPSKGGDGSPLFSFSTEDDGSGEDSDAPAKPEGPPLPVRVFGEDFMLDLTLGFGVRGWLPQQYEAIDVDAEHYFTFTVDVKAKLFGFLNIRQGYYESNSVSGPRTEEAAVAAQIGKYAPKAIWLLGVVGVPVSRAWEPIVRYESRAFETRAQRKQGVTTAVCTIPRDATLMVDGCEGELLDEPGERLKVISGFETFVAGVRYDHSKRSGAVVSNEKIKGKFPPVYAGVGLMSYRKPYQLVFGQDVISDEFLFDGRFRGAGLALGTELGGGLDNYYAKIDAQAGLGEVSLTEELTLRELLGQVCSGATTDVCVEDEFLVGYVQGTATLGYRWPLIRVAPTLILEPTIKAGGASFFLVDTVVDEGEEATSPTVNWDFLWSARMSLLIPF